MKYTLEDLIKSINESSFSQEDKIYIETVANLAYAVGAKDMNEQTLKKLEKERKLNEETGIREEMLGKMCPATENQ